MATREDAARLIEIGDQLQKLSIELGVIAHRIPRRSPSHRAPNKSMPMTRKLGRDVRAYARAHKRMGIQAIGRVFQVDGGRVSEATTPGDKPWSAPPGWTR